ncbi:DnaT-like ssDNA-binding domain-containing protein [Spartinivicinus poritis]|uniref:DnaT-like ssDNA-binding domain-containing protein n=1 Tax=Spartinivicinus poritis TaxID=2994640 RepID=A0ABT5UEL4_9GAMM|nr:DnaT-like ssDNA-binding domain-containing protein [Spartinivicinus sp. A2-2]MDE1464816.1 DnaT-like ssDNA-binding domain-containing protein [Spartinivicinus sp. A2-2]
MSVQAIAWAFSLSNLEPNKKIVLLALADNANDQGYCWPAMDTIAEKTSLSRSTVKRHIKSLAELNLLTKFERASASGATTSNHFYLHVGCQINLDHSSEAEENEGDQNDPPSNNGGVQNELPENIGGSPMNREGCTSDLGRGSPVTPKPSLESSYTTTTNTREVKNSEPDIFQKKYETRIKPQGTPMTENWEPDWKRVKASLIRAGITPDFANLKLDEFKLYWLGRGDLHPAWTARFIQHLIDQWPRHQRQQELNQALDQKNEQQVKQIQKQCENMQSSEGWSGDLGDF